METREVKQDPTQLSVPFLDGTVQPPISGALNRIRAQMSKQEYTKRGTKVKPEIKIKTVVKEPELSDRQKKYNGWLEESIELKKALYQVWPTHIEVQGGRVYKSAGDLMALCTNFKHSMKHAPETLGELHTGMKLQALQNIAANIRFLERLDAIGKKIEENDGEPVQEGTHSVEVGGLHGSDFPFDQLH